MRIADVTAFPISFRLAPYCDAPAVQSDHIVRAADGGPTSFVDGQAVCALHNYLREQPGWWVEPHQARHPHHDPDRPLRHEHADTPAARRLRSPARQSRLLHMASTTDQPSRASGFVSSP